MTFHLFHQFDISVSLVRHIIKGSGTGREIVITNIDAYRLSVLIRRCWCDSYSDDGAIWEKSKSNLDEVKKNMDENVIRDAYEMAKAKGPLCD